MHFCRVVAEGDGRESGFQDGCYFSIGMSQSQKNQFTDPINSDPICYLIGRFIGGYRYLSKKFYTLETGGNANKT